MGKPSEKGLEGKNKCVPLHSQTVSSGKFIERLQQKKSKKIKFYLVIKNKVVILHSQTVSNDKAGAMKKFFELMMRQQ